MELDQIDPTLVTPDGIDNVLRFLPELLAPEATYGDDLNAKLVGPQEIEIGGGGLDDEGIAFVEACYAANLVQSFDWMRWTEESPGIAGSAEFIGSADLRAIIAEIKLIRWPAPYEPDSTWVDAAVLPAGSGDLARDFATRRVLNSPKYFRICRECGERNAIGHMMSDKPGAICHGCAQRNHGVVF